MDVKVQTERSYHSQSIIEQLRYWVPAVADVARVYEVDEPEGWRLYAIPAVEGAAAIEVLLRKDGAFDIEVAGERYEGCVLASRDMLVHMLDAIAAGKVVQRTWVSSATGARHGIETIIPLPDGEWRRGTTVPNDHEVMAKLDRHFLPYRR